jgi:hypothetical protein
MPQWAIALAEAGLLVAVGCAIAVQFEPTQKYLTDVSAQGQPRIASDDDLYAWMIPYDYDLIRKVRTEYPKGTSVLVDYKVDNTNNVTIATAGIMQRMYLTLFPDYYPKPGVDELIICAHKDVRPTDEMLSKGRLLSLVRRKVAEAGQ